METPDTNVRMLIHITGFRDGAEWPPIGGTLSVTASEAADLINAGHAEPVDTSNEGFVSLTEIKRLEEAETDGQPPAETPATSDPGATQPDESKAVDLAAPQEETTDGTPTDTGPAAPQEGDQGAATDSDHPTSTESRDETTDTEVMPTTRDAILAWAAGDVARATAALAAEQAAEKPRSSLVEGLERIIANAKS